MKKKKQELHTDTKIIGSRFILVFRDNQRRNFRASKIKCT